MRWQPIALAVALLYCATNPAFAQAQRPETGGGGGGAAEADPGRAVDRESPAERERPGTHFETRDGRPVEVPDGFHLERHDDGVYLVPDAPRATPGNGAPAGPPDRPPAAGPAEADRPAAARERLDHADPRPAPPAAREAQPTQPQPAQPHPRAEAAPPARPAEAAAVRIEHAEINRGVVMSPALVERTRMLAARYHQATGRAVRVTSAIRTAADQARAMYDKILMGSGGDYGRRAAFRSILRVYQDGRAAGRPRAQIEAEMSQAIQQAIDRGEFNPRHLTGNAIDLRVHGMDVEALRRAAREAGAQRILLEDNPPCLHVEFPR